MQLSSKLMEIPDEIHQKKKRRWYIRDPEVRDIVRNCVILRFTERESLEELSKRGYSMSDREFRRIKKTLESNKQRLDKVIQQDILSDVIRHRDTMKKMEERLLDIRKKKEDTPTELRVISEIIKTSRTFVDFYDSSIVISALLDFQKNNDHVKESK